MATVFLRRGKEKRLLSGHLWVYEGEIEQIQGEVGEGEVVDVRTAAGKFVGRGTYTSRSKIAVRLLTHRQEEIDEEFFRRRLADAVAYRRQLSIDATGYRLVYSEGDFLPGLIVDRYGEVLVLQTTTVGMEVRKPLIVQLLDDLLNPRYIYERNDLNVRKLEGLPSVKGFLRGEGETLVEIEESGVRFLVDIEGGQKTGFFLDQRENRRAIAEYVGGAEVLDVFCYTGGFAIHAACAGAKSVWGIENSETAVTMARQNAALNGVLDRCTFLVGNAFDHLRRLSQEGKQFDVVILDPPAFVKTKSALAGGLAGYKEINLRALKLLRPGGILVSCSCSFHVDEALLLAVVADAARDTRRTLRLIESRGQARDHPVLPSMPETRYLKCLIFQVS
ncbi:MAG: class I SAM-dependent rRNA methyltransferase [Armatimonadota bacterium]|nr:class I SAM-dependent rRNA methyltransferase [Armatimonadota bacterium]